MNSLLNELLNELSVEQNGEEEALELKERRNRKCPYRSYACLAGMHTMGSSSGSWKSVELNRIATRELQLKTSHSSQLQG